MSSTSSSGSSSQGRPLDPRDNIYRYNEQLIQTIEQQKPWETDLKYFQTTEISALAAMKMLRHALAGVEKGQAQGGKPVEIMGLIVGKPDTKKIVVMDAIPLPVEGFETSVLADNPDIHNFNIEVSENLELTRPERIIGWYHSHPFDVETFSHCYLSQTDVTTQWMWQRVDDPFIAIVVDPLRSIAKQKPEFGAFRVYPPTHNPPKNEAPDGQIVPDENTRVSRWGTCAHRYYAMEVAYFMSSLSQHLLGVLARNHLWVRVLASTSILEPENRSRFPDRISNVSEKVGQHEVQIAHSRSAPNPSKRSDEDSVIAKATQSGADLSIEQSQSFVSQVSKDMLFNFIVSGAQVPQE